VSGQVGGGGSPDTKASNCRIYVNNEEREKKKNGRGKERGEGSLGGKKIGFTCG